VEEQLRELRDSGALRNLPGEGAPLPADPDAEAGEAWASRHLSRVAAARARWADLRQEIGEERARLLARLRAHDAWLRGRAKVIATVPAERILGETARTRETDRRVRLEVAARMEELNALVRRHNILVTGSTLHLATVTLDDLIAEARQAS
jgi:DnaJ-like protein